MKLVYLWIMLLGFLLTPVVRAEAAITGVGATYPLPVYARWARAYTKQTGYPVNYKATGSSDGLAQILARGVDFGAVDTRIPPDELAELGLIQFPVLLGAIVPVVNVTGILPGQLRLSGEVLAELYLGKITMWNHPAIRALNPDLKLPRQPVFLVHRIKGSGTTYHFTRFLAQHHERWRSDIGEGMEVVWPRLQHLMGGRGSRGVAMVVNSTPGALGYVTLSFAIGNNMVYTQLQNEQGNFVRPSLDSIKAAASQLDWFREPDPPYQKTAPSNGDSWPITVATYILMHRLQPDPERARAVLRFFEWGYLQGDTIAEALNYVVMPEQVETKIRRIWADHLRGPKEESLYPFQ